jgi:hypothetical protein
MHTYSLREVRSMLGLSRAVIGGLVEAGFVSPQRGPRRELRFSFQDMVLLRTAHRLQAARIPPRRIVQSLRKLRAALPESMPLTGLRITAVGNDVAVRTGGAPWSADSGQLLLDFDVDGLAVAPAQTVAARRTPAPPAARPSAPPPVAPPPSAAQWFERGVALERGDVPAAIEAYRHAIEADPACADAYLNLGVLLGDAGRASEAVRLYRRAVARLPAHALLHFNLAVMLEDSGRADEALAAYGRCLALDPGLADAHFNAARLHDRLGHAKQAIRHYSAYRRLSKAAPTR